MEHQTVSFMASWAHDIRAHELAHSWFGNMITLATWHDIWINEASQPTPTGFLLKIWAMAIGGLFGKM